MKILNYKLFVGLILVFVVFFFIYLKFFKIDQLDEVLNSDVKEEIFSSSNIIENIEYSSKDLKGNEYIILAEEGEIDLNNNDVIFLKDVTAYIKMIKNNETITIVSDFGKYNTINFDTIFSKNVNINYLDNKIIGDYLDFSMLKNLLIVSKNVVYTNPENILKADVIEVDTITKDTKIFMHNTKEKVNVESIN
tara:strand:- start:41 stop:619 length:579 start_codon:yes stop_codon:yes gene_type:complete